MPCRNAMVSLWFCIQNVNKLFIGKGAIFLCKLQYYSSAPISTCLSCNGMFYIEEILLHTNDFVKYLGVISSGTDLYGFPFAMIKQHKNLTVDNWVLLFLQSLY